jgi:hypothetical protein
MVLTPAPVSSVRQPGSTRPARKRRTSSPSAHVVSWPGASSCSFGGAASRRSTASKRPSIGHPSTAAERRRRHTSAQKIDKGTD